MSDIPPLSDDDGEAKQAEKQQYDLGDVGKKSMQGVPLDENTRLELYELRNKNADRLELAEKIKDLPKDEQENIRLSGTVTGKETVIDDVKGNEKLVFPDPSTKLQETQGEETETEE